MPEYPEVTVVSNRLDVLLKYKKIKKVDIFLTKIVKNINSDLFKQILKDKIILAVYNIGKYIIFKLNDGYKIISHLRMEGKYFYKSETDNKIGSHDLIIFHFSDNTKLIYNDTRRFGTIELIDYDVFENPSIKKLAKLPKDLSSSHLHKKLKTKTSFIKTTLLDQTLVLGLGNIYVDETLHAAKISPLRKASSLDKDEIKKILHLAQKIMDKSIEEGGSSVNSYTSVNSEVGKYQNELKVYGRNGLNCLNCKNSELKKIKVNGRGTTYCEKCQK